MAGFAERRGDLKPRNAGSFQNVEKARRGILPWNVQEEGSVADTETGLTSGFGGRRRLCPCCFLPPMWPPLVTAAVGTRASYAGVCSEPTVTDFARDTQTPPACAST